MKQGVFTRLYWLLSTGLATCLAGVSTAAEPVAQRVIAVSGEPAPGTEAGTVFDQYLLGLPTVNARGDVAFRAGLTGSGVNYYTQGSIWVAPGGGGAGLTLAYRGTDASNVYRVDPYDVGSGFDRLTAPFMNARGELTLWALVNAKFTLLAGSPGQYRTVVATGDAPAGLPGGVLINRGASALSMIDDAGDVYFEALTNQGLDQVAAFTSTAGAAPQSVIYKHGPVPGVVGGTMSGFSSQSLAAGGRVGIIGRYAIPTTREGGYGVWWGTAGNLKLVAGSEEVAPGVEGGMTFDGFESHTSTNASGAMVFTAYLKTASGAYGGRATYLYDGQSLERIAVPGTPVPALGEGFTLAFGSAHRINDRGQVLVEGIGKGPNAGDVSFATWVRWEEDGVTPITRDGMAAPGLGDGVTFSSASVIGFNGIGQSLVRAVLSGPGVDSTNNVSFWGVDPLGGYTLVARTGGTIITADGERAVTGLNASSIQAGSRDTPLAAAALSDLGQVAYQVALADGTYANLLATLPAVIPGDANNDLLVDTTDFQILYAHLYQTGDRTVGDFNYDGLVGFADFQILERNFGRSVDGMTIGGGLPSELAAMVPEPSMVCLVGVGVVGLLGRRRRGRIAR